MPLALKWVPAVACILILGAEIPLIWRINVNWDEFYFLSHIYSQVRGDLSQVFQTAYVHLFTWLIRVPGDEIDQIRFARSLMLFVLALTSVLVLRLAARWSPPGTAAVAPLAYLACSPVLRHGDAFRADSLLALLSVSVLLLLTHPSKTSRALLAGAAVFGLALALTVKAVLLLPVIVIIADDGREVAAAARIRRSTVRLVLFAAASGAVAVLIVALHRWSLPAEILESSTQFADRSVHTTLLDVPFFPRAAYFWATARTDPMTWLLIAIGTLASFAQRRFSLTALVLSVTPVLFYRNAFPYYYVVMLAPACVLAAAGLETIGRYVRERVNEPAARKVLLACVGLLVVQAIANISNLRQDEQLGERATLTAVHRIFPHPVAYIDHSGMVASFRKVNFFMSSWGLQEYRSRGVAFMRNAMTRFRPPMLLADREMLEPGTGAFRHWLLPEDQALIEQFYLPYWGAIRVAGAHVTLRGEAPVTLAFPFQGRYRLVARVPVIINGTVHRQGDILGVSDASRATLQAAPGVRLPVDVRFYSAAAAVPPAQDPPEMSLYFGL